MPVALKTKGLSKSYGDLMALQPLDLKVSSGELVVLVGSNGAGKTTFMDLVAGLLEPTEGTVSIFGAPAGTVDARAAMTFLPDDPSLYEDLSVMEHAEYIAGLHGSEDWEDRTVGLMERLNLSHRADDLPSRFSRGLKQKTALLLGLVRPFSLLLADEPFVGLDALGKRVFIELTLEASEAGATVIVSTHQLEFMEHATRVLALRDGGLIFDGPPSKADVLELVS